MKLSEQAWNNASVIISATIAHPFNQELMHGTLSQDRFSYYIEQDSYFLRDFGRCNKIISSRIEHNYKEVFEQHANTCFAAEKTIFSKFSISEKSNKISLALISLDNYLLATTALEPIEIAIAAVLPCFWLYREVGQSVFSGSNIANPYFTWINTYSNPKFIENVNQMIRIFDDFADRSSEETKQKMLDAFYKTTVLEWHFWNDAYNINSFDDLNCIGTTAEDYVEL